MAFAVVRLSSSLTSLRTSVACCKTKGGQSKAVAAAQHDLLFAMHTWPQCPPVPRVYDLLLRQT